MNSTIVHGQLDLCNPETQADGGWGGGCRTAIEKELAGIPDIPNGNRLIELEYVSVTDRKIRNQLRNVGAIEKTVRHCVLFSQLASNFPPACIRK